MYTHATPTPCHPAPARLPIIHSTAPRTVGASESASTRAITAVKNAPTTTPASRSTRVSSARPAALATRKTRTIASSAPANAAAGTAHEVAASPNASTITAAAAEPPLMPRM